MSETKQTTVDVPLVLGVMNQLGVLSTSLGTLGRALEEGSKLDWTGGDETGTALFEQLEQPEKGSILAVTSTKEAVDGVIHSLGMTAGIWNKTEGTNIEMNH